MAQYLVRLPVQVDVDKPGDAVPAMIDELNLRGLRNLQYVVDRVNDDGNIERVGVFDGFGRSASGDSSDDTATLDDEASDADLVGYAESLNDQHTVQ